MVPVGESRQCPDHEEISVGSCQTCSREVCEICLEDLDSPGDFECPECGARLLAEERKSVTTLSVVCDVVRRGGRTWLSVDDSDPQEAFGGSFVGYGCAECSFRVPGVKDEKGLIKWLKQHKMLGKPERR